MCENNYFPFLSNVLCLPCDHYLYGNIGCGGKCDSSKYEETRNILCEEGGCKEGFYNIEGICFPCSVGDDYCTKCTYEPEIKINYNGVITANDTNLKYYKCQACISNKYRINEYGRCDHCFILNCLNCHFNSFHDTYPICDECIYGYYVDKKGGCSKCHCPVPIPNGECMVCSDNPYDFSNSECRCNTSYVLTSEANCTECPKNCLQCNYINEEKICYQCNPGYYLNSFHECITCGDNCKYCHLGGSNNVICDTCFEGFNLNSDKNCLTCPDNCESCKIKSNQIVCTKCKQRYSLNNKGICKQCPEHCLECFWKNSINDFGCSECESDNEYSFENNYIIGKDDQCIRCQDIKELGGEGCIQCLFDINNNKYNCLRCLGDTRGLRECNNCPIPDRIFDPIRNYAYITNEYKCLLNNRTLPEYLNGCLEAKNNALTKKYECNICKPEFIPVIDERSCRTPEEIDLTSDCIKAKTLITSYGIFYTCLQCKFSLENYNFYDYLGVVYFRDEIKITTAFLEYWNVKVINHLGKMNCLKQEEEIDNCLEAKEEIDGHRFCTKCIYNYPFKYSNKYNQTICGEDCAQYSFKKFKWCYLCDDRYYGNPGCVKESGCSYNNANDQLDCYECKKGYYKYSHQCFPCENKDERCLECSFEEEKGIKCEKCKEGFYLDKEKGKCELNPIDENKPTEKKEIICNKNYFKTKNETCVYCKSRNNGGPACSLCDYDKMENGTEKDNIICKYCPKEAVLSKENKCFFCEEELGKGCNKCQFVYDEENEIDKLECISCYDNYKLTEKKQCIHYQSYFDLIPHCALQEDKIINNTEEIIYESKCISCSNEFYLNDKSECEKYSLKDCAYKEINDFLKYGNCKSFCQTRNKAVIDYYETKINENFEKEKIIFDLYKYINDMNDKAISKEIFTESFFSKDTLLKGNISHNKSVEKLYVEIFVNYSKSFIQLDNITNLFFECYTNLSVLFTNLNCEKIYFDYISKFIEFIKYADLIGYYHLHLLTMYYLKENKELYPHIQNYYNEYYNYSNYMLKELNNSMYDCLLITTGDSIIFINSSIIISPIFQYRRMNSIEQYTKKIKQFYENYHEFISKGKDLEKSLFTLLEKNEFFYDNIFYRYPPLPKPDILYSLLDNYLLVEPKKSSEIIIQTQIIDDIGINFIKMSGYFCLGNSGKGIENEPKNLKKCKKAEYDEINDNYICKECVAGYSLDEEVNLCRQIIKIKTELYPGLENCYKKNIGTNSNPVYSCYKCYNETNLLIEIENGSKFCKPNDIYELKGCTEIKVNTSYYNDIYNCTNCSTSYVPYNSKFYQRKICQYIYGDITRKKDLDFSFYDDIDSSDKVPVVNGKCENKKLFTHDNKNCFFCNDRYVGMVGCIGSCSFSIKRNNVLECEEGKCKTGFIEVSKGVCESCNSINEGCIECNYELEYNNNYLGLRRKRHFVCKKCDIGFIQSEDGSCHKCIELGIEHCDKCKAMPEFDNDIMCYECEEGYFLNYYRECIKCANNQVRNNNNECIYCEDIEDGGIEGCSMCQNENDKIFCTECKEGFIFYENNKTCLRISKHEELQEFINCKNIKLNEINNKMECIKCSNEYTLLEEGSKLRCVSFDFVDNLYKEYNNNCQKFIDLNTEDNPLYTCVKCSYEEMTL